MNEQRQLPRCAVGRSSTDTALRNLPGAGVAGQGGTGTCPSSLLVGGPETWRKVLLLLEKGAPSTAPRRALPFSSALPHLPPHCGGPQGPRSQQPSPCPLLQAYCTFATFAALPGSFARTRPTPCSPVAVVPLHMTLPPSTSRGHDHTTGQLEASVKVGATARLGAVQGEQRTLR